VSRLSEILPRRIDVRLLLLALALTAIGIAMVTSTTADTPRAALGSRQLVFALLGMLGAGVFLVVDYRFLLQYSPGLFAASLLPLFYVLAFGHRVSGSKSWIRFGGGFQVQPSEVTKITTALLIAWILENDDRAYLRGKTIAALGVAIGVPVLLILMQPDLGVALTYMPMLLAGLFFGGLRARWWLLLIVAGTVTVGGSWFVLKDYQKDRIRTFLDPELAARGAGYQVRQAKIAIGSGGILGKGWEKGTQSRLGFLPVRHTDFVFAALAEEWGFVGVAAVLTLYGMFLARGFALARDARDRGGSMLVLVLSCALAVQVIVNIAMNVGFLPTTGITLPFLSYGGSSLIVCWAMVGLMLSVAYRRFVNV
jgi:rod shape determining protein RodA